jgi:hypothetical protein
MAGTLVAIRCNRANLANTHSVRQILSVRAYLLLHLQTTRNCSVTLSGYETANIFFTGMMPGMSIDDQEPWAMYNIRALIGFDGQDKVTKSDKFLDTIEERLTDMYPGNEPSKSELKEARQSAIKSYEKVGYLPTGEFKDGMWWVESWNELQKAKPKNDRLTLVYGHDSKRDIQIKDHSFGLDSGCVNGGKMTALVLQPRGAGDEETTTLEHSLVSVSCADGS